MQNVVSIIVYHGSLQNISHRKHAANTKWLLLSNFRYSDLVCRLCCTCMVEHAPLKNANWNQGRGTDLEQEPKQFWMGQIVLNGGAGALNMSSSSTDINSLWSKPIVQIIQRFLASNGPNLFGAGAKSFQRLEPKPKLLDAWSWIRSPKFEFRVHSPGCNICFMRISTNLITQIFVEQYYFSNRNSFT